MSKLDWSTINLDYAKKIKMIGDNGPIKIIIGGPLDSGKYWWHVKVEEKGEADSIEEARQAALDSVKYDLKEARDGDDV